MEPHVSEICTPLLERVLLQLHHVRKSLQGWTACCPAHDDRHPSLSVNLGKEGQVLLHCHAGCSVEHIVAAVDLTMADLFPASLSSTYQRALRQGISLLDFARDKMLHWRFLINQGIVEQSGGGLRIPYYQEDGIIAPRQRIRTALIAKEGSWWTKDPGEIVAYGLEHLESARKEKYLILVEGETDRLTLLLHGYHALGIPGAEMAKTTLKSSYLEGIETLYIFQEPDRAGQQFVESIAELLQKWAWQGTAFIVSLPDAKDPNEFHKQDWKAFKAGFQQALDQAKPCYKASISSDVPISSPRAKLDIAVPFTLQHLLEAQVEVTQWTIPHLIPEGLLFLVGKPKQGKSWFALQLALAIASGETMLEVYQANQGNVLYLALEDTPQRLQARSKQLLPSATALPIGLEFVLRWPRLDEGGLTQFEVYLETHPQVRLVIIDTWAKLAPFSPSRTRTQYEGDYAALAPLKQVADTHHLSILMIHHLRKAAGHDVLDEITGSTGLTGAMDEILLLKRTREQNEATLFITGRDVQEQTLSLTFNSTTARWTVKEIEDERDERSDI